MSEPNTRASIDTPTSKPRVLLLYVMHFASLLIFATVIASDAITVRFALAVILIGMSCFIYMTDKEEMHAAVRASVFEEIEQDAIRSRSRAVYRQVAFRVDLPLHEDCEPRPGRSQDLHQP